MLTVKDALAHPADLLTAVHADADWQVNSELRLLAAWCAAQALLGVLVMEQDNARRELLEVQRELEVARGDVLRRLGRLRELRVEEPLLPHDGGDVGLPVTQAIERVALVRVSVLEAKK